MILHISPNVIFIHQFISFVEKTFPDKSMKYVIYQKIKGKELPTNKKVKKIDYSLSFASIIALLILAVEINRSRKIIIHGLNEAATILLLFFMPWNLKKCYWFSWGDDIYKELRPKNLKLRVLFFFKKKVIQGFGCIVVEIDGEFEKIKSTFDTKKRRIKSFKYPSNIFSLPKTETESNTSKRLCLLIGNSADPSNNHEEVFKQIQKIIVNTKKDVEILCPLSYGNKLYAQKINERGEQYFGSRFIPITEFMAYEEYVNLLEKVDIAIFNHKRQQAMGNIVNLLGMGKKVYIRREITSWDFFKQLDIQVYSSNNIDLTPLPAEVKERNISKIKSHFSEERLKNDLKIIFT